MTCYDVPAAQSTARFSPDEIILYGLKLNSTDDYALIDLSAGDQLPAARPVLRIQLQIAATLQTSSEYAAAAIYGYAYEGHCYRFDKPRILIFQIGADFPAEGCGFNFVATTTPYRMWRIRAKTRVLELTPAADFADVTILDSNLPGKRPPNTYANDMQLAHRGGKLTRG